MNALAVIDALEQRLQRLDARAKAAPGQLGFDLSAPAATAGGSGQPCGQGWISKAKTCRKEEGQAAPASSKPNGTYRPTPQVKEGVTVKPMTINPGGDSSYDPKTEKEKAQGGLKYYRSSQGGSAKQNYFFRDRQAAEHWYADDVAKSDADIEVGSTNRRGKEWQAEYRASYEGTRNMLASASDRELLETIESYAAAGSATSRGTATDIRIGGNKHSRSIREGTFTAKPADALQSPAVPASKPALTSQEITTSKQQAAFARQQQQAAKAAGDDRGAQAWRQEERTVERARVQAAVSRSQQAQTSLFGVTEYDETMPLFRQRKDAADPVSVLLGQILDESLPGAVVLDWATHPRGVTAGRVTADGLVYRFRCDSDSVAYRPGWDGLDERQWEHRSEGFLSARDPAARLDFKRVKFSQQRSKRQCSKGYSCGSACISLNKECRVSPRNAMSKARLRQLQTLAKEGDATAAQRAQELQMERDAKAQKLQQGRQVGRLQKMLEDPRIAEMVRTGKIPDAEPQAAAPKPGDVRNVSPDGIEVDPDRFQYKIGASQSGEVGSLSGVKRWDPNLAGVVSVWQDPADGKTYVINGHNRLALARRLGAEEVTVRYLKASNAKEARAIGAMQNIAEGAGSDTDAAKFFRDTGLTSMEEVQAKGLPLRSGRAERGLALAQLPDEMFQDVVQGDLRTRRAAVIGGSGLDHDKQREVYKVLKQRPSMTDETLQEYVEHLAVSSRQTQTEINLFGTETKSVDTGLARAELSNGLKKALSREARLLGAVSKNSQAVELLERKGGNVINVEQSQQQAQEAGSVLRVFNQLKSTGAVGAALDQAAARLTAGEKRSTVQKELREAVIQAMEDELRQLGLRKDPPTNEAPTMSMFDSADPIALLEARLDAVKRKCNTGYACGSSCISPAKDCRSEGKANTGKQRLKRLQALAGGAQGGRGIGQLRGGAAAAKAEEIKASRSAQAAQLRQQRAQRPGAGPARDRGGALAVSGGQDLQTQGQPQGGGRRRSGGLADTLKASIDQMKAADARQFGMIAEQLFEAGWSLEKGGRYKGMSKEQARESFKQDFMRQMQAQQASPEARARSQRLQQRAAESGSVAGAMKAMIEEMKAGDERLQQIGEKAIDLRAQAFELEMAEGGTAGQLGGSSKRRRLRGRKDSADLFNALESRLALLDARQEVAA